MAESSINSRRAEIQQLADGLEPGNRELNPETFAEDHSAHNHSHDGAQLLRLYMPMTIGEFTSADFALLEPDDRRDWLRMKVRINRGENEPDDAKSYFNGIEAAFEDSFRVVTPELLADPTKMNIVQCVDPYEDKQLDMLYFSDDQHIKLPAGLAWFDMTGLMYDWISARIFNPELAAGMHRNCGGLAIVGALTGERQETLRTSAEEKAKRIAHEVAAVVRQMYASRKGSRLDPDAANALANFGGPRLTFSTGNVGTAADFITPKTVHIFKIDSLFTTEELNRNVEGWVDRSLRANQQTQESS